MILTQVRRENGKETEKQASPELGVVSASELTLTTADRRARRKKNAKVEVDPKRNQERRGKYE